MVSAAVAKQTRAQQRATQARRAEAKRLEEARRGRNRTIVTGIGVVVVAALLLAAYLPGSDSTSATGDTSAEAWDLPALDGNGRVAISEFRGKPTVVSFYASWCEVCEQEMPGLLALSEQIGDRVNFVAVNSQDDGHGQGDAEKWGITGKWPIAVDIGGSNGSDLSMGTFGMRGMPLNLIYDASGNLVKVHPGGLAAQDAVTLLTQLTEFGA
jgi:thiol-disulfide isomerase/thioredoxin